MVGVAPWVLDSHVLEDPMVGYKDVVCPGPYYPPLPYHFPCPLVPTPRPSSRKEVYRKILQTCCRHRRRDLLVPSLATLLPKFHVQILHNNQLRTPWFLRHQCLHVSDIFPVAWRQVTPKNVPASLPRRQLARDDVRAKLTYQLDCEDGGVPIEDRDAALVSDRCRRRDNPIPSRSSRAHFLRKFGLLEDPYIYICLNITK